MIKIVELRAISLNGRYILPDERDRRVQLRLTTASDENLGPFLYEALGRGQADPAIASSDYRDLAFKCTHFLLFNYLSFTLFRNSYCRL